MNEISIKRAVMKASEGDAQWCAQEKVTLGVVVPTPGKKGVSSLFLRREIPCFLHKF